MARFSVVIVGRGTNPHVRAFEDFAVAMTAALRALGHEVVDVGQGGRLIVFGAHLMVDEHQLLPLDTIIFNAEQLCAEGNTWLLPAYAAMMQRHVVWDYSKTNIARLRELGFPRLVHCPVAFMPTMIHPEVAPNGEDIDVLYYGSVNTRRREILDALEARPTLKVVRLFDVYGRERDQMIARAKIVLNLHYYEKAIFEMFRVSQLFANRKCVVSEDGGCDTETEAFAARSTALVPRSEIIQTCFTLVDVPSARAEIGERGFRHFERTSLVNEVRRALQESDQ